MPVAAPGIAGKNAFECQPASLQRAIFLQGFNCILRAGRRIAALRTQQGREELLVKPDQVYKGFSDHEAGALSFPASFPETFFTTVIASSKVKGSCPENIRKTCSWLAPGIAWYKACFCSRQASFSNRLTLLRPVAFLILFLGMLKPTCTGALSGPVAGSSLYTTRKGKTENASPVWKSVSICFRSFNLSMACNVNR